MSKSSEEALMHESPRGIWVVRKWTRETLLDRKKSMEPGEMT